MGVATRVSGPYDIAGRRTRGEVLDRENCPLRRLLAEAKGVPGVVRREEESEARPQGSKGGLEIGSALPILSVAEWKREKNSPRVLRDAGCCGFATHGEAAEAEASTRVMLYMSTNPM